MATGTLYGAVESLLNKGLITSIPSDDVRRKVYAISEKGEKILRADYQRMAQSLFTVLKFHLREEGLTPF